MATRSWNLSSGMDGNITRMFESDVIENWQGRSVYLARSVPPRGTIMASEALLPAYSACNTRRAGIEIWEGWRQRDASG